MIDPLDGTVNYLYGLPTWAVSVAVQQARRDARRRGRRRRCARETYRAVRRRRSLRERGGLGPCGPPRRSDQARCRDGLQLRLRPSVPTRRGDRAAANRRLRDIRRGGSAAIDLCDVAAGRLDGYYERGLHPWDYAAGDLIAREAGALTGGRPGEPAHDVPDRGGLARRLRAAAGSCWRSTAPGTTDARTPDRAPPAAGPPPRSARPRSAPCSRRGPRRGHHAGAPLRLPPPVRALGRRSLTSTPCSAASRRRSSSSSCSTSARNSSPLFAGLGSDRFPWSLCAAGVLR